MHTDNSSWLMSVQFDLYAINLAKFICKQQVRIYPGKWRISLELQETESGIRTTVVGIDFCTGVFIVDSLDKIMHTCDLNAEIL